MKVKFVEFYQGVKTYPHSYNPGDVVEIDDDAGAELVAMGKAEEVKPASRSKSKEAKADEE